MISDAEDLLAYTTRGSEEAFRSLVERHAPMVHGVAVRVARDQGLAEEITQNVFTILARKARTLDSGRLPGWLYNAATSEARNAVRKEQRRRRHTHSYQQQNTPMSSAPDEAPPPWHQVAPLLDAAMEKLPAADRELVVLHYFRRQTFRQISEALGRPEETCKKRSQRAVQRLADLLKRRGLPTATAPALGALMLSAVALTPPPASAAAISATALHSATLATTTGSTPLLLSLQLMTTKQILITAAAVLAIASIPAVVLMKPSPPPAATASATAAPSPQRTAETSPAKAPAAVKAEKINWQDFAHKSLETGNSLMRELAARKMARRLKDLSNEELAAALKEVTGDGAIGGNARSELRMMIANELGERDPLAALAGFADDYAKGFTYIDLHGAFAAFAKKDPAGADAWLQEQLAAGRLGKAVGADANWRESFIFEGDVIHAIAQTDPVAAGRRILNAPPEQQAGLLSSANDLNFGDSFDQAKKYADATGDNTLLTALLNSREIENNASIGDARRLAQITSRLGQIPDPALREAVRARVEEAKAHPAVGVPLDDIINASPDKP